VTKTPSILHTTTYFPENSYAHKEVEPYMEKWLSEADERTLRRGMAIYSHSRIEVRHTIAPVEEIFSPRPIGQTNALYKEKAIDHAPRAFEKAFQESGISPQEIDFVISTSCTGYMIPSIDAYLLEKFEFRSGTKRLPITQLGCNAGVSAMIYARDYLTAYPEHKVAILNLEFPSNTVQLGDFSLDNIVGTALFADALAVTFLGHTESPSLEIIDSHMHQVPNSLDILGYSLVNTGFRMNLSAELPSLIESHFLEIALPFLARNELSLESIEHFLVHPGGFKIIAKLEKVLGRYDRDLKITKEIMLRNGNLSSATITHIVHDYLKESQAKTHGDHVLIMGFGPGFSAHLVLARWSQEGSASPS